MLEIVNIKVRGARQCETQLRGSHGREGPSWHFGPVSWQVDHLPDSGDQVDGVAGQHYQDDVQGDVGVCRFSVSQLTLRTWYL